MSLWATNFIRDCKIADTIRDEGLTTPDTVERFDNIVYGEDKNIHILDVYRPKNMEGKLPVIVSVHGGGWVYGDKEVYQFYCMNLAERGFVVVNFTYRLAPTYKYPAAIEDTNSVFCWLIKHADEYGIDKNNIFALGDSAGATNIGIYSAILTNNEYAKRYSFVTPKDLELRAIGLNCGIYNMMDHDATLELSDIFEEAGSYEEREMISLVNHVTDNYPPCHIFTASGDFLKEQPAELIKVLEDKKVPYEYKLYGTDDYLLYHVFHCNIKTMDAKIANDNEIQFFRKYMQ